VLSAAWPKCVDTGGKKLIPSVKQLTGVMGGRGAV
jgi:hypothetical protein